MGFEPTTPGLKVRDPSDEPGTQAPPAGIRARVPIDEASLDDLPEKQESVGRRSVPATDIWRPPFPYVRRLMGSRSTALSASPRAQ